MGCPFCRRLDTSSRIVHYSHSDPEHGILQTTQQNASPTCYESLLTNMITTAEFLMFMFQLFQWMTHRSRSILLDAVVFSILSMTPAVEYFWRNLFNDMDQGITTLLCIYVFMIMTITVDVWVHNGMS